MKLTKEYIYEQIQKMSGIELINFKEEKNILNLFYLYVALVK